MAGYAAQDEEVRQGIDHVDAVQLARDPDRQSFVGELVDDVEHPEPPPVVGALLDEVIGPHMITMHRPQPDARARRYGVSSLILLAFLGNYPHRCASRCANKISREGERAKIEPPAHHMMLVFSILGILCAIFGFFHGPDFY